MENKKGLPARNPLCAGAPGETAPCHPWPAPCGSPRNASRDDQTRSRRVCRTPYVGSSQSRRRQSTDKKGLAWRPSLFVLARPERLRLAVHGRRPAGHRATHRAMTKRVPDAFVELPTSGVLNPDERTNEKGPPFGGPFVICGAPGEIRTPDLLVRSQTLYPTELRAHRTDRSREAGQIPVETGI